MAITANHTCCVVHARLRGEGLSVTLCPAQDTPNNDSDTGAADGKAVTSTERTAAGQKAAQQMLSSILVSWTKGQTAKAAHPSMLPDDQQRVLDWILEHKDVTITKFAKVRHVPS